MNKTMNEEEKDSVIDTGRSSAGDPSKEGESSTNNMNMDNYVLKSQYEAAEKKLGEQGMELGEARKFFKDAAPLLEKLNESPEIVQAIIDGKIDDKLAQAVLDGKVKIEDATSVAKAQEEVKKDLGKKEYNSLSSAEIEKLISDKVESIVNEKTRHLEGKFNEGDEKREFITDVDNFIKNTKDFPEYADAIKDWLDENPNQYDIQLAYNFVKGKAYAEKYSKEEEIRTAEEAKKIAANAGGGNSRGGFVGKEKDLVDQLIAGKSSPNVL